MQRDLVQFSRAVRGAGRKAKLIRLDPPRTVDIYVHARGLNTSEPVGDIVEQVYEYRIPALELLNAGFVSHPQKFDRIHDSYDDCIRTLTGEVQPLFKKGTLVGYVVKASG